MSIHNGFFIWIIAQYDAMSRLTNLVCGTGNGTLATFAYSLGPTGNRLSLLENVNGAGRYYVWNYDQMYRLTNEVVRGATDGNINYGYDPVGNRTNRVSTMAGLNDQAPVYDPNDLMTNTDEYDPNGNTTNSANNFYQYDALDHLTNVNSGEIVMTYDGDGDRMSKTVNGTTTYYLVDDENPSGYSQVLEEYQGSSLSKVYNYGADLISQVQPNVSTNYFVFDGHGSTRMLLDSGGAVENEFAYDAFGNLIASNEMPQTAYLYCGQQWDSDLGFYYNRARYLNPNTGRFWTMDTYDGDNEDPMSLHKYLYAADDPVNLDDPSGNASLAALALSPLFALSSAAVASDVPIAGNVDLPLSQLGSLALPNTVCVCVRADNDHAWICVSNLTTHVVHTYGRWELGYPTGASVKARTSGVNIDVELHRRYGASRDIYLPSFTPTINAGYNLYNNNCATYAKSEWKRASGESLSDWSFFSQAPTFDDPGVLKDSILSKNGGKKEVFINSP